MFLRRRVEDVLLRCSFCHKTQDQVETLISSPSEAFNRAYICNECVEVCNSVLEEYWKQESPSALRATAR
jgi:ATP-dependent Clp protease ATP-binding subunit ClpX